jgi:glycine dehydrogenase
MMDEVGLGSLAELYAHIPAQFQFAEPLAVPTELGRDALAKEMDRLATKNHTGMSLIGDGLPDYAIHPIVAEVLKIRELSTAYTPYQPERSQGTLITQWIYQCNMAALTGFEAINASLYERSTALFEALLTAFRVGKDKRRVLVSEGIYPGDREVIETHFRGTDFICEWIPLDPETALLDLAALESNLSASPDDVAAVALPQVNHLGYLEAVDAQVALCERLGVSTIGIIDPMHLVGGGLKPPSQWGTYGTDMVVGEAQHVAFNPCFGGPGLGIFGVRMDERRRNLVRSTPGRYVGKATDVSGRDCFVAVMSAREQHIRRDKATSNICSNQAFIATLAGAALLASGEDGLADKRKRVQANVERAWKLFLSCEGIRCYRSENAFFNEITLEVAADVEGLLKAAADAGIHLGVNVSERVPGSKSLLKVALHDRELDWEKLEAFLDARFDRHNPSIPAIPAWDANALRNGPVGLASFDLEALVAYYQELGQLNVSPDNGIYPLGSCTMKYNPQINEWAAALPGFQFIHPQVDPSSAQGCLEVLHETQEWFKAITGLAGVTTQPLAGAQGELVGIKLFQAYHDAAGQSDRDIVLIPQTAHGTNFATAVMAGYASGRRGRKDAGVVVLKTDALGGINMEDFAEKMSLYRDRLVGIMITNPNTCGVFESNFRVIADAVHEAGGLVYMDGANMNAIAGWVDLSKLGVDAVHNNIHKTWSIPHGGGGPGDGFVAVSECLVDFLPGYQIVKQADGMFVPVKAPRSIGSFHRHWGNFNHKVRCLTYLKALGKDGIPRMSAVAVLAARYLFKQLLEHYEELPRGSVSTPRMHEFVVSFKEEIWKLAEGAGVAKTAVMPGLGKLFLDFGYHAPTVAFPEPLGVMIEPTECYSKAELDRFVEVAVTLVDLIRKKPAVLKEAPYFTPIDRVDEVLANRNPTLSEALAALPKTHPNRRNPLCCWMHLLQR